MATEDDWIDLTRREFAEIPVIDLRLSHEELVPALAQACEHPVRARCIRCTRHVNHVNHVPATANRRMPCRVAGLLLLGGIAGKCRANSCHARAGKTNSTRTATRPADAPLAGQDAVIPAADAAMDAARSFFRLSNSAKLAVRNRPEMQYQVRNPWDGLVYAVPGSGNGYRAAGEDVYFAKDQRESINFGREQLEPGEDPPYSNLWPAEQATDRRVGLGDADLLPVGWRSIVLAHQHQMLQLSVRLRRLVALALGASEDAFDEFFDRPTFQTGMVYYHAVVSDPVRKTCARPEYLHRVRNACRRCGAWSGDGYVQHPAAC